MKKLSIKAFTAVGMLSSIAYVLMILNFPIPPFPVFLEIDFSDIPALIAALIYGPAAGILVEIIKNILDYFMKGSPTGVPVGHIANVIAGITYILPTYYIYRKFKSKKGMTIGLMAGTIIMAIFMSVLNYYVILPAYTLFLNAQAMSAPETRQMVVGAILPFNIVKGFFITIVFMLLFNKLSNWINKQASY
ncbi:ECF transporter S component [Bacillus aquiflavi]|uniref:Riboflavin transporter n=1 Tax=Bacillus aquiflavi TaxID=2672567 RepID=A0A6B3VX77_9BACI|nr:ECF transporter S component [Bacillus aquiflavi]MBA4537325.1 ECF transporter S component [Bacillus aquiflavi]NEY81582.1 ECF transporter S component [Bacillus aquiflavi]UAC47112.1 ECF transporter S component [Bacillus aquiflavi]